MMDNSYYDQLQERLGFGEGGVDDAEDADVVIHELAHFIHQSLTSDNMSINEGFAEVSFSGHHISIFIFERSSY